MAKIYSPLPEGEGQGEGAMMPIPPELLVFARQLRKGQTDAERMLWYILRGRRFLGYKFRRQYPVGGYIVDFYCHDVGLAIELDGGGHNSKEQQQYDAERSITLASLSINVVRFWNSEVLNSLEDVLEEIYRILKSPPSSGLRPPSPSGRRDG